jgi:regulator of replication initiation timing
MNLLEEKNRLTMENGTLRRQLEELGSRMKEFEYGIQDKHYIPPIMPNGQQVK